MNFILIYSEQLAFLKLSLYFYIDFIKESYVGSVVIV